MDTAKCAAIFAANKGVSISLRERESPIQITNIGGGFDEVHNEAIRRGLESGETDAAIDLCAHNSGHWQRDDDRGDF